MSKHLFQKGQSGNPHGRPKRQKIDVYALFEEQDFNPFLELIELVRNPDTGKQAKCDALVELCNYVAPKFKSVEITTDPENPVTVNLNFSKDGNQLSSDSNN